MPVDPRKLRQLVLVEKTVHRLGKQHIQKYWVRAGDDEGPHDEPVQQQQRTGKPRPQGMSDEDWKKELERRRIKNEYVRQWRAKRKEQGQLKQPGDPPPPLPPPIQPGLSPKKEKEGEEDEKVRKRREYVKRWREKQKLAKQQGKPPPPEKPPPPMEPEKPRQPGELKKANFVRAPAARWLNLNRRVIEGVGNDLVDQFKTTPPDVKPYGVTGIESTRMPRGVLGQYSTGVWQRGTIQLKSDVVKNLVAQVRAGGEATPAGSEAVRVLTHEMFHAASHPDYEYEGRRNKSRPHAVMQEATTETLAQMHKAKVMTALGVTPRPDDTRPLFQHFGVHDELQLTRPTSYPTYVRQFGRAVEAIEGSDNLDQNVERWAREIKGTRGNMRYERMADALLEKHGMPRDHPDFAAARMKVVGGLRAVLQDDAVKDIHGIVNRAIGTAGGVRRRA